MKKIFRLLLPLIISFICAAIFFSVYNNYLLDNSLANLKVSLKELDTVKNLEEVQKVTALLNDSFLAELSKGDFDLAFAVKMEVSEQLTEQASKDAKQNTQGYIAKLSSASNIDFSAIVSEKIAKETQISDIKHFIRDAIDKEISQRPVILSKIDDIVISLFPGRRKTSSAIVEDRIKKITVLLPKYNGKELQEKYIEIGKLYLAIKNYNEAENYLNKSITVDSENDSGIKAKFFLGILFKTKKDFKAAGALFGALKEKLPKEWKSFAIYQEADCLYRMGEIKKAVALFEELYKENPSQEIPQLSQFRAAYVYLYDLKDFTRAKEAFMKLQKDHPQLRLSDYISHKIEPDITWLYCKEGFKLLEEGYQSSTVEKYQESFSKFNSALKMAHNYSVAYMGKALAFYFLGNKEEAIKEGVQAQQADPSNDEVIANLGFIYFNSGMIDKAVEQYIKALKINPYSDIYNYNLGTLYIKKGEYKKAERYFKEAILINPKYAYAYNNLGYILWSYGRYNDAKENLKKAIALKPDYLDAQYNLGVVYYALGNYEDSRMEFILAEKIQPQFRQIQWYLNKLSKKLGYN